MEADNRPYSHARIQRLVRHYGSISRAARAGNLSPTTLIKYLNGSRTKLSGATRTTLDLLYIRAF